MSNTFRPVPFGAVLFSALLLGVGNAVLVAIASTVASLVVPHARADVEDLVAFALVSGLATSVALAFADRPMTYRQRTTSPYGLVVAFDHLALPLTVGAIVGWLTCGPRWFVVGGACTFLAYLVQFFLLTPWKKTVDDEDLKARSRAFAAVTRQYVEEYKDDLGELSRQKAQRKHEEQPARLRKRDHG